MDSPGNPTRPIRDNGVRFQPVIHNAKDLSPDQKAVIESLLGRLVLENEALSIRAIEPPVLADERKQELAEQLKQYFAEVDARREPALRKTPPRSMLNQSKHATQLAVQKHLRGWFQPSDRTPAQS